MYSEKSLRMIPKYGCLLLGLLTVCGAVAQHPDDEYYPYAARAGGAYAASC